LLSNNSTSSFISIGGAPPGPTPSYFLGVSPGWLNTMKVPLTAGRDFKPSDVSPSVAIVNQAFSEVFFGGENPVGKSFQTDGGGGPRTEIVGVVGNAKYRTMRGPIMPTAYVPFQSQNAAGQLDRKSYGTFVIRTGKVDPSTIAQTLRGEIARSQPELYVTNIRTQVELVQSHTVRERLLALLAVFFMTVVLLLAGIGLYGVLEYSVLQQRHEIGIRLAIGARPAEVVGRTLRPALTMVILGAGFGVILGISIARFFEALLYDVKATDWSVLAIPSLAIAASALLASAPALIRVVRMDPAYLLRSE
jgi:hypothetical protein